jgi:16S rRNA (guanine(527)-N(7))-methyltransferase RsmG
MSISAWVPGRKKMPVPGWFAELLNWAKLSPQQIERLYEHYVLLERWNKRINLTSVEAGEQMVIRHYCESLFFGARLPADIRSLADIGSGAGFPGVPIAILRPTCEVALVESHQRKAVFLKEASRSLSNVSVFSQRAEDLSTKFDWIVARAVRPMEIVALVPQLALKIGLMLGEEHFLELQTAKHIAWSEPIRLPWGDRRICVFGSCSTWNVHG